MSLLYNCNLLVSLIRLLALEYTPSRRFCTVQEEEEVTFEVMIKEEPFEIVTTLCQFFSGETYVRKRCNKMYFTLQQCEVLTMARPFLNGI